MVVIPELQDDNDYIDVLTKKIKSLTDENTKLKKELKNQNDILESIKDENLRLYETLKKHQSAFSEIIMQKDDDISIFEKELSKYIEEKSQLQKQIDKLTLKSKRYDKFQGNLLKIQLKAESTALKMIEEAQSQSMESISIIDDIAKEVYLFMIDIDKLKEDLKIGTVTIEDRISSICYKFNYHLEILKQIKKNFYETNNLNIYDYE